MSIFNKAGEAWMLRAEGDRLLANALTDRMASLLGYAARATGKILCQAWDLTTRETSFHLQSKPGRNVGR